MLPHLKNQITTLRRKSTSVGEIFKRHGSATIHGH